MTWTSQMTAASPSPQQQNRWKGRRCLGAALIPQPAAFPPKNICCSLSDTCFLLFSANGSVQNRPPKKKNPPEHLQQQQQRLLCQVESRNPRRDQPGSDPLLASLQPRLCSRSYIAGEGVKLMTAFMCSV